ncbi:MAG: DUF4159 domain-containing protein [Rhodospirillaceae bacterium]|nr:DUF4159 domain-containing protein [Rhodospirillaceae bacterium]
MVTLGALTFATPWVLLALAVLPLVWLLLRVTPPAARRLAFPAIRLLFGLTSPEKSSARTPWWLLLLRLACIVLLIVALSEPVLNQRQAMQSSPLVVVVDDGWAAAPQWTQRQSALVRVLESAERESRPVMIVTTAPAQAGTADALSFASPGQALSLARAMTAKPWPTNRTNVLKRLLNSDLRPPAEALWLTDGVASTADEEMSEFLHKLGRLTVLTSSNRTGSFVLGPADRVPEGDDNIIEVTVRRPAKAIAPPMSTAITALDEAGRTVARAEANFEDGKSVSTARFSVPTELGNRMARLAVDNDAGAASIYLLDDRWTRRPVGVVSDNPDGIVTPLLEDGYYVTQALLPFADVHSGTLPNLLQRDLAVMVLASGNRVTAPEVTLLEPWIERGGVLVRFAGSTLDGNVDSLMPVRLRGGGRTFGGTMSWTEPVGLAPFPEESPFAGLAVPNDVLVSSQVLAEPSPGLTGRTWARLEDGTPLVTADRRGQGWVVLFHVTATPEWSSLPLSGVMVDMLRRVLDLSRGVNEATSTLPQSLPASEVLTGDGQLITPPPTVLALDRDDIGDPSIGPSHPPGYYGVGATRLAVNLGPTIGPIDAQGAWPSNIAVTNFDAVAAERSLKPWLLFAALVLFTADLIVSLILRGLVQTPQASRVGTTAAIGLLIVATSSHPALAVDEEVDPATIDAVLETRLAYVRTGRKNIDQLSAQGLGTLTDVLAARTSAEMAVPAEVDPETDELFPYPIVYWRIAPDQEPPSEQAAARINDYLGRGGTIVFDAPNQIGANDGDEGEQVGQALNNVLMRLNVSQLMQVPENHVLRRSFYLLPDLPGRYTGAPVYVERGSVSNDGVSSIIIGSHDWAAVWARDNRGLPIYPAVPGGERQREWSYRFGVNLVMYALTGNYKADQVHIPAIMQRLTQ